MGSTEIVSEEFTVSKNKWKKLLCLFLGFSFMAIVKIYEED
jgi:hypothetical protein